MSLVITLSLAIHRCSRLLQQSPAQPATTLDHTLIDAPAPNLRSTMAPPAIHGYPLLRLNIPSTIGALDTSLAPGTTPMRRPNPNTHRRLPTPPAKVHVGEHG